MQIESNEENNLISLQNVVSRKQYPVNVNGATWMEPSN